MHACIHIIAHRHDGVDDEVEEAPEAEAEAGDPAHATMMRMMTMMMRMKIMMMTTTTMKK